MSQSASVMWQFPYVTCLDIHSWWFTAHDLVFTKISCCYTYSFMLGDWRFTEGWGKDPLLVYQGSYSQGWETSYFPCLHVIIKLDEMYAESWTMIDKSSVMRNKTCHNKSLNSCHQPKVCESHNFQITGVKSLITKSVRAGACILKSKLKRQSARSSSYEVASNKSKKYVIWKFSVRNAEP